MSSERDGLDSAKVIWVVCVAIALLFFARGAFLPYVFPLFEGLDPGLDYGQIALILNGYILAQSLFAPLAGWLADKTSVRSALLLAIGLGGGSFLVIASAPGFAVCATMIFLAGMAFVLGKIALNSLLVLNSSPEMLRSSVARRATLLNLGSFLGNSLALRSLGLWGAKVHALLLAGLALPLALGFLADPKSQAAAAPKKSSWCLGDAKDLLRKQSFLADALRRFAMVLPYGCWGTVIPKYAIDRYGCNDPVWTIGLVSLLTTLLGAHLLSVHLSKKLYSLGFKWEWWSMCSVLCYCAGLLLLSFVPSPVFLPLAIAVFICGEVLMTPCFDETAKKHSHAASMGTCMGLLHLVDGAGRLLGAAFALGLYGLLRGGDWASCFWLIAVAVFLTVSSLLHLLASRLAASAKGSPR
ncbi:MAG: hypothetical protein RL095_835 [Verrucomicrobiota bacterium]|jgi:MFS family permease